MGRLLKADGAMAGRYFQRPEDPRRHVACDPELLTQTPPGVRGIAEFQDRSGGEADAEEVDLARLRGPGLPASRAIDVPMRHVAHQDILRLTTFVAVASITDPACLGRTGQGPAILCRDFAVAGLPTLFAASRVAAVSGPFDAHVLPAHEVSASEEKNAVVAVLRIGTEQGCSDLRRGVRTTRADAVVTLRSMIPDDASAFNRDTAAPAAPDQKTSAIVEARENFEVRAGGRFMKGSDEWGRPDGNFDALNDAGEGG